MTRLGTFRDVVLLVVGTVGVLNQEFGRAQSDPGLLMFYAAIFGLTAFLPNGLADAVRARGLEPLPPAPPPAPPAPPASAPPEELPSA